MSEEQSDKLKLKLKSTDTNRFKVETSTHKVQKPDVPASEGPEIQAPTQQISDPMSQRQTNTGRFKRVDVSGQDATATTIAMPGAAQDDGIKKTETVRLKVVRATPTEQPAPSAAPAINLGSTPAAPTAPAAPASSSSTIKLNLRRPAGPAVPEAPAAPAAPESPATPSTGTLKIRPPEGAAQTPPPAAGSAAATVKLTLPSQQQAAPAEPEARPKLSIKKDDAPATPTAEGTVAVPPPAEEAPKPGGKLKLVSKKDSAAATVAAPPPTPTKTEEEKAEGEEQAAPQEQKKEAGKTILAKPKRDDDRPGQDLPMPGQYGAYQGESELGVFEGVAAIIAFLGVGFGVYQLVMDLLNHIQ